MPDDTDALSSNAQCDATEVSRRHSSDVIGMMLAIREGQNINQGGADVVSELTQPVINGKIASGDNEPQPALNTLMAQVLAPANLQTAWKHVRGNKGAAGVDDVTIEAYPAWAKRHWSATCRALKRGYYMPSPVLRVEIPKPDGSLRQLGIPTVNDRVIQQAIAQVLTPIIDPTFSQYSYGFRPTRSAHQAVRQVQRYIKQNRDVAVDIDLSKFFDQVDHDIVMGKLSGYIADKALLKLMGRILRADIEVDGELQANRRGTPQGGPLSPLLANVMLDSLDKYLDAENLIPRATPMILSSVFVPPRQQTG